MHSSRMCTVGSSGHIFGGGGCLLQGWYLVPGVNLVLGGRTWSRGVYLVPGGVSASGVYLARGGAPGHGRCVPSPRGVYLVMGVSALGVYLVLGGVPGPWGVPGPRGGT